MCPMGKISTLPPEVASRIAAGEVIERPASALKELLENSLDAGASHIEVQIEKGGKKLISISDDGCGMSPEDLELCLHRHATSKIKTASDLEHISTFGFRGEALPSIASVSRLTITTRLPSEDTGHKITSNGGKNTPVEPVGCAPGTYVEVRDLFYNLPARRKFMRSDQTELQHSIEAFINASLPNPEVSFKFYKEGDLFYVLPSSKNYKQRHRDIFGGELTDPLLEISESLKDISLNMLLSPPQLTRSNAKNIRIFLNNRPVKSKNLQHAVIAACRNSIPQDRFPVAVLFIEIDPMLVDVNVHPSKAEVKFSDERAVHGFIYETIKRALGSVKVPSFSAGATKGWSIAGRSAGTVTSLPGPMQRTTNTEPISIEEVARRLEESALKENNGAFSKLKVIGQFRNTYLICENEDELLLIDQHAAHERVTFEKLKKNLSQGALQGQELMFPLTVELDKSSIEILKNNLPLFEKLGFEVDLFGEDTVLIRKAPPLLQSGEAIETFKNILENISLSPVRNENNLLEKHLFTIACHSSVRAHQRLTDAEIKSLLNEMDKIDFSATCPHGRPVVARLNERDIKKYFNRS